MSPHATSFGSRFTINDEKHKLRGDDMDSKKSGLRHEAFQTTILAGQHRVGKHMTTISSSDDVITGPSQEQIRIAMEWAFLGGD